MSNVFANLAREHDLRLVAMAALIGSIGCLMGLTLLTRGTGTRLSRWAWLCGAAFVFGSAVWATDVIALLAFRPGLPMAFHAAPGLDALAVGLAGPLAAFVICVGRPNNVAASIASGMILGATIAALHLLDMQALNLFAGGAYDFASAVVACALGILVGGAALRIAATLKSPQQRLGGAAVLVLMILAVHVVSTAGFAPAVPLPAAAAGRAARESLAIGIVAAALVILLLGLAASVIDEHLTNRTLAETRRLRQLADAAFEGILIHRNGTTLDANAALGQLTGIAPEQLAGRDVVDLAAPESADLLRHSIHTPSGEITEIEIAVADGTRRPVEILSRPIERDGYPAVVLAMRDISERKRAEERIRYLAHHDWLTGLPNRVLLDDRLEQALNLCARHAQGVAVLCLDLDGFKLINDLHGHCFGDELLARVAERLRNRIRSVDTVARLGGDEFAVVQRYERQQNAAATLAERLLAGLSAPFEIEGRQVLIGTSIGVARFPEDGGTVAELLRNADTALYRAKRDGRGTFRFFETAMDAQLHARRLLEQDLRQAIGKCQLELHYQPQFACRSAGSPGYRLAGFEALLRWTHPVHGAVAATDFIPLAEECGLIIPLGNWALETSCAEAASWQVPVPVSVNMSLAQFRQPELPSLVFDILRRTGLPPERLELEVTESLLIEGTDTALSTLAALKAEGIQIALDDFGTGYSSLSHLRRFPFDRLKIDGSFVKGLGQNEKSLAIIRAILALANSLHLEVTAEGVETELQLDLLREQNCSQFQGFLLGRPVPPERLLRYFAGPEHRPVAAELRPHAVTAGSVTAI